MEVISKLRSYSLKKSFSQQTTMKVKQTLPLGQQEELVHHAHSGIQNLLVLVIHADFDHTDYTVQRSVQARRIAAEFVYKQQQCEENSIK